MDTSVDDKERARKLTAAEQRRLERFEATCAQLAEQGYASCELTVGIVRANIYALLLAIPVVAVGLVVFFAVNREPSFGSGFAHGGVVFIISFVVLVFVHELVHGLAWSLFAPGRWRDIELGFMREYLTPYCACNAPLRRGPYVFGALAPLVVVGVVPTVAAIAMGSFLLLFIGLVMVISAGGDILIAVKVLRHRTAATDVLVCDHPTQAGCVVFER